MEAVSQGVETDEELARRWQEGDLRAFDELYERHAPTVARRLRRILWHSQEVEDAFQMIFLEVHRALPRYRPEASFGAWLGGIVFNVTRRHLRSRWQRRWLRPLSDERLARQSNQSDPSVEDRVIGDELTRRLYEAMETLPAKKRIAFALHELEGMGLSDIAREIDATPQTVWARVQSARSILQKKLGLQP